MRIYGGISSETPWQIKDKDQIKSIMDQLESYDKPYIEWSATYRDREDTYRVIVFKQKIEQIYFYPTDEAQPNRVSESSHE